MIPAKLESLVQQLEREGIFTTSSHALENQALQSAHKVLLGALELHALYLSAQEDPILDLARAARLLEQIQKASAEADRSAFICHLRSAVTAAQIAQKIASLAREFLHDIKDLTHRNNRRHAA